MSVLVSHRTYRRFNRRVVAGAVGALCLVMALNVGVDPYRVFHLIDWGSGYTDNERYNKVAHLLAHPERHDAFIVGSSRMGLYNPDTLNRLRPGRHYYNLATFGGSAQDALLMLKALQRREVTIREVVFGIDLFPFLEGDGEVTPAYRHHPAASGESYASFYTGYLMSPSAMHAWLKVQQSRMDAPDLEFDFEGVGRFYLRRWDREIAADHEAYMAANFEATQNTMVPRGVVWNEGRFDELGALVRWGTASDVVLHLFIQPHHHTELGRYDAATRAVFKHRIESITGPIPDYSDRADWSHNNRWYYEPKHYRPVLADQVVATLFTEPTPLAQYTNPLDKDEQR